MPTNLRTQLSELATAFATGVLAAVRSASIDDLVVEAGPARGGARARGRSAGSPGAASQGPKGRLKRRSQAEVQVVLGKIVSLLRGKKAGMRSEQIRDALKLDKRELPRVLHLGLKSRKLRSRGHKRATVYSVA